MRTGKAILVAAILWATSFAAFAATPIDINTASAEAFARAMKGVGPAKAAAIIEYRAQHGPFTSVEELLQVRGIGDKTLADNRDKISVSQPQ